MSARARGVDTNIGQVIVGGLDDGPRASNFSLKAEDINSGFPMVLSFELDGDTEQVP